MRNNKILKIELFDELGQGGPITLCHDEIAANFHPLEMRKLLIEEKHPRTAIGINDHQIFLIVVDGRQPSSEGLTLYELAEFMRSLGAHTALNIGGGGCSTLCINGTVTNSPSQGSERPVSEAICFYAAA